MTDRICISINNRCNLRCRYCHFHEKEAAIEAADMDVLQILRNIRQYIQQEAVPSFKIGFVGNGEPLLDYDLLRGYIEEISDLLQSGVISAYTITNGTLLDREKIAFLSGHRVNVGVSIDGPKEIHDKWRCGSFDLIMQNIELFREVTGGYPSMNCTVGRDVLDQAEQTISFFAPFRSRITFSRMIGRYGISLPEFRQFLDRASQSLHVRRGGYDCTMYGGMCGAGINNPFYANGRIYLCGNCVDLTASLPSDTPPDQVRFSLPDFDRNLCYKESVLKK